MIQVGSKIKHISADLTQPKQLCNAAGDPLYVGGSDVSSDNHDHVLKAAESCQIHSGVSMVSAGQSEVQVFDARQDRISELEAELAAR